MNQQWADVVAQLYMLEVKVSEIELAPTEGTDFDDNMDSISRLIETNLRIAYEEAKE